jgi:hypothetical protein
VVAQADVVLAEVDRETELVRQDGYRAIPFDAAYVKVPVVEPKDVSNR